MGRRERREQEGKDYKGREERNGERAVGGLWGWIYTV